METIFNAETDLEIRHFPQSFPFVGTQTLEKIYSGHRPVSTPTRLFLRAVTLPLEFSRKYLPVTWIHQLGRFQPQVVLRIGRITGRFIMSQNEIRSWSAGESAY